MDQIIVMMLIITISPIRANFDDATWMDDVDQFRSESCICVADSTPVCASDGRIYKNHCEFQCRNEYLSLELDILKMEECLPASAESSSVSLNVSTDLVTDSELKETTNSSFTSSPSLNLSTQPMTTVKPTTTFLPQVSSSLSTLPPVPLLKTSPSTIIPQFVTNINPNDVDSWKPEYCLCRPENKPICASDGITYKNVCEFKCRNQFLGWGLVVSKLGRCENKYVTTPPKSVSSKDESYWKPEFCLCLPLLNPICASDGNTYNNLCEFKCRNHYVEWNLTIVKFKKCKCNSQTNKHPKVTPLLELESDFVDSWKSETCGCAPVDYPICATDGRSYRNLCEFKCRNQYLSWELLIVKFGKCESLPFFTSENEVDDDSSNYWKLLHNVRNSSSYNFY